MYQSISTLIILYFQTINFVQKLKITMKLLWFSLKIERLGSSTTLSNVDVFF